MFDGHNRKIWLGPTAFVDGDTRFTHVDLTEEWRDKIHWEDMFDRVWVAKRQYSHRQRGELEAAASGDLVGEPHRSDVYRSDVESYWSDEGELTLQLWRPETGDAVFVATRLE